MREIDVAAVRQAVKEMFLSAGVQIDPAVLRALDAARKNAPSELSEFVLDILAKNARIARDTCSPLCQDTGMAVVFLEIGQDVHFGGGLLADALNEGVREAYREGYFRKSVLSPLSRLNTGDNTPAVLHTEITAGDRVKISVMCKGFGSENMSRLFMLSPSDGIDGVKDAVVRAAAEAKSNPCPPIIVGVGIGGTMEKAALMSKKALFRHLESQNEIPELREIEKECLERINALGIGAGGFGGGLTALAVFAESFPTHLAGLPVAVTIQCHASRHGEVIL